MARIPKENLAEQINSNVSDMNKIRIVDVQKAYSVSRDNAEKALKLLVEEYGWTYDNNEYIRSNDVKYIDTNVKEIDNNVKEIDNNDKIHADNDRIIYTSIDPFTSKEINITKKTLLEKIEKFVTTGKSYGKAWPIILAHELGITSSELITLEAQTTNDKMISKAFEMFKDKYIVSLLAQNVLTLQNPDVKQKLNIKGSGETVAMAIGIMKEDDISKENFTENDIGDIND